jgi:outer membrane lipoprotein-sorting protein
MLSRLALPVLLLLASPAAAIEPQELLEAVDRNINPESYETYRKLINIEPDGSKQEFVLFSVKKGADKVVALFLSPASEKGRSTLRLGDNMWLYMPEVGKPIRITSMQSVTGGVFNNADILAVDYTSEYTPEGLEEKADAYVLRLKARTDSVAYDRLVMTVEKKRLLPVTIDAHAAGGMLIKTLHFSDVKDFGGGIVRPAVVETDSPLQKGYKSVMVFANVKKREFKDEVFTLNFLPRVGELR